MTIYKRKTRYDAKVRRRQGVHGTKWHKAGWSPVACHRYGFFRQRGMIQEKRRLADLTVVLGESWIGNLSNDELRELFSHE